MAMFRVEMSDKQKALDYYELHSGDYEQSAGFGPLRFLRAQERRTVVEAAGFEALAVPGEVLDVGCGAGFYALSAKRAGHRVHAMDAVEGMVRQLSGKVDHVWCGDIESLETPQHYDVVVCAGVLDFVLNPARALRNLARAVKPEGRLVILVPASDFFGQIYRAEKKCFGIRVNLFSLDWLRQAGAGCGLALSSASKGIPTNWVATYRKAPASANTVFAS
jgi:2-polyprenyl-3-methyl-5-hydroxy-6-metoxy-1,4-benzoquinol methylase